MSLLLLIETAKEIAQSPKTVITVASATAATGVSTKLELIPLDAGTIASVVGIVSTVVVLFFVVWKHILEIKLLKKQLADQQ